MIELLEILYVIIKKSNCAALRPPFSSLTQPLYFFVMAMLSNLHNDGNSRHEERDISHFRLLTDPAGITYEVLNYIYIGTGTEASPYFVHFLENDPYNHLLFPRWKKYVCTMLVAFATLAVTFISSAYSGAVPGIIDQFGVPEGVAVLGISVFVLGFALGPLFWAPLSGKLLYLHSPESK
jgi:Ca2+/H+ antiporter